MGDTDITDYMCRKLTQPDKLLSPTKFHNSVHNAPSGYWSISAGNRAPSTFVGGYLESFGAGLLEATSQAQAVGSPVLLVAYDIQDHPPFSGVTEIGESLACALVVAPQESTNGVGGLHVVADITPTHGAVPASLPGSPALAELAAANPIGIGLALLEQIVARQRGESGETRIAIPAAKKLWLDVRFGPPEQR